MGLCYSHKAYVICERSLTFNFLGKNLQNQTFYAKGFNKTNTNPFSLYCLLKKIPN